ncbi:MAG: C39 family peptidase [Terrimicrobiaceae bacterium]|nr:C39 family peptidase [Terrimicrobiaceae bacterium]
MHAWAIPVLLMAGLASGQEPAAPVDVRDTFLSPEFWGREPGGIEQELGPAGFRWTSAARDTLRSASRQLRFGGQRVYEALVRFEGGKPASTSLIFYNRGDAGELDRETFEKLLADTRGLLDAAFGASGTDRGRDASSAVKAEGAEWSSPAARGVLEWSATRESRVKNIPFRAEFVRLTISPPGTDDRPRVGATPPPSARDVVRSFRGRDHVTRGSKGELLIEGVPMVDQGQKGYCVVATVERVMRYFGADVDQHELAQIANTETEGGTSPNAMVEALKKLTMRLGVKAREVMPFDFQDFLKMIEDYNRAAKREKVPPVNLGGPVVDIGACYRQMSPELLKTLRMKKQADFGKFQREIQKSLEEGIPLLWSVQLGIVPEPGLPQASGGHMRLIIGWDPSTQEIVYSDSWGAGHERKRMAAVDAWVITNSLAAVQPAGT